MENPKFLMYVDGKGSANNNKYYNMFPQGSTFKAEYGRVGSSPQVANYPISLFNKKYKEKINKGYTDITDLKQQKVVIDQMSGNKSFDEFYDVFRKYTGDSVRKTYLIDSCSQLQIDEAQKILNTIQSESNLDNVNDLLLELYKVIPRVIYKVQNELLTDLSVKDKKIQKEQDALDSMTSSNIVYSSNPFKDLNISFEEIQVTKEIENLIYSTMKRYSCKIYKVFEIKNNTLELEYENWYNKQKNKHTELLIHGTRNPNVFSILKSGLLIRPTNAAMISGAAYGEGTYFSAHADKSLGYTGYDNDKIFFLHDVHMGNYFTYDGWYRDGKSISRNQMNYNSLQKLGYDSLYVKAGDGLLNSEYIVYNTCQYKYKYLIWLK